MNFYLKLQSILKIYFFLLSIEEVRHERSYYKQLSEHKEVVRAMHIFDSGLLLLEPKIDKFLKKIYLKHCYLWADDVAESLSQFAESDPLTIDIQDKFIMFDERTAELEEADQFTQIETIGFHLNELYEDFVNYSKSWKEQLGEFLSKLYNVKLMEFVDFVKDVENILLRPLNDLDDVSVAITCLERVRENLIV